MINTRRIREIMFAKGMAIRHPSDQEIRMLQDHMKHSEACMEFILNCVPVEQTYISGLILLDWEGFTNCNLQGGYLRIIAEHGFLHVAGTEGGNTFLIDLWDENVCYADHECVGSLDEITYYDKQTMRVMSTRDYNHHTLRYAMFKLFDSVEEFYETVVAQDFEEYINILDAGNYREYYQSLGKDVRNS